MSLNDKQIEACKTIDKFLADATHHDMLLMGPAGSGKTTVITRALASRHGIVVFCAFTNKATRVLKQALDKTDTTSGATASAVIKTMTIHKLLALEPCDSFDDNLKFKFNLSQCIATWKEYNIIIFDECSTISRDLFDYVSAVRGALAEDNIFIKCIFLGDYWQLPPVGEDFSCVFKTATEQKWYVKKLEAVMRSKNEDIQNINQQLIEKSAVIKSKVSAVKNFRYYPRNLLKCRAVDIDQSAGYIAHSEIVPAYLKYMDSDAIVLTYTKENARKTNKEIQEAIDQLLNRETKYLHEDAPYFQPYDRCVLTRPAVPRKYKVKYKADTEYYLIEGADDTEDNTVYNGEVLRVVSARDVLIHLPYMHKVSAIYSAQLLTVDYPGVPNSPSVELFNVPWELITADIKKVHRSYVKKKEMMASLHSALPTIERGYALTLYKAQGSEWNTVIINSRSILASIHKDETTEPTATQKVKLFRSIYTAVSRAAERVLIC